MEHSNKPPWPSLSDLLQLRDILFEPYKENQHAAEQLNKKQEACALIGTWAERNTIPHSIRCTALLVEAQMCRFNETLSLTMIQTIYASVISRFVTGFVDIARSKRVMPNMYDEAKNIGMPEEWVDVRHAIVHGGDLPSIEMFDSLTRECLGWLWENFWRDLGREKSNDTSDGHLTNYGIDGSDADAVNTGNTDKEAGDGIQKLLDCLSEFLRLRLHEIRTHDRQSMQAVQDAVPVILEFCNGQEKNAKQLATIIVNEKYMIPQDRKPGDSMQGAFLIWKPLLATLQKQIPTFSLAFLSYMVSVLSKPNHENLRSFAFMEAVYNWTAVLLPSREDSEVALEAVEQREGQSWRETWSALMTRCFMEPATPWTQKLVKEMMERGDEAFRRRWERYMLDMDASL